VVAEKLEALVKLGRELGVTYHASTEVERLVIEKLRRLRRERPGYYPRAVTPS